MYITQFEYEEFDGDIDFVQLSHLHAINSNLKLVSCESTFDIVINVHLDNSGVSLPIRQDK